MPVTLHVELGPSQASVEQVLAIDVDELLEVVNDLAAAPVVWFWTLPSGATFRITATRADTPNPAEPSTG